MDKDIVFLVWHRAKDNSAAGTTIAIIISANASQAVAIGAAENMKLGVESSPARICI